MIITGAVLETAGRPRPYAQSLPISVGPLSLDPPRAGELLVEMEVACLCHSDLAVVDGTRPRPMPMLLGHEAAGIVRDATDTDIQVGSRVVMTFLPRCGRCSACATDGLLPCTEGSRSNSAGELLNGGSRLRRDGEVVHHHLGVSGFATHAVVDRRSVVVVPHDVPPEVAALLGCAVLTGGGALLNAARPRQGDVVVVVGLGGVGLAAVMSARALGSKRVIGIDANADKLEAAIQFGAAEAYTPIEAAQRGLLADVVVEAAGHPLALETAIERSAVGGRIVTVGLPSPNARASIAPLDLVTGGRSIIGSYLGSALPVRDIPVFADLWRDGLLPIERLVTDEIALSDINVGMDRLAEGTVIRQMIRLGGGAS